MDKALGENKAKYTHAGSLFLALQERGASRGQSDFNVSNRCRGRGMAKEGMEADTWNHLSLGPIPSLHPSRRHQSQPCVSH